MRVTASLDWRTWSSRAVLPLVPLLPVKCNTDGYSSSELYGRSEGSGNRCLIVAPTLSQGHGVGKMFAAGGVGCLQLCARVSAWVSARRGNRVGVSSIGQGSVWVDDQLSGQVGQRAHVGWVLLGMILSTAPQQHLLTRIPEELSRKRGQNLGVLNTRGGGGHNCD